MTKRIAVTVFWLLLSLHPLAVAKECIGLVSSSSDKFWDEMHEGVRAAGDKLGYQVYYRGPNNESSYKAQSIIIDAIEKQGCVGLLLAPNHPERIQDVERAQAKGIVTVFLDRGLNGVSGVAVVATDNYAAGRFAGKQMLSRLPNNATNIAVFRLHKDVVTTTARERGFVDVMTENGLNIVLDTYVGTTIEDVKINVIKALRDFGQPVQGIFTPNESTTVGVVDAVSFVKLSEKPVMVGFDSNEFIKQAIAKGQLEGTVLQKPYDMGYIGVQLIDEKIKQGKPLHSVVTGLSFQSRDSLEP